MNDLKELLMAEVKDTEYVSIEYLENCNESSLTDEWLEIGQT